MKLPQLPLRDLFWLVVVVAMGCGWWLERADRMYEADALVQLRKQQDAHYDQLRELQFQLVREKVKYELSQQRDVLRKRS